MCLDLVCCRSVIRHWPGANFQILLSEAQSKSHKFLFGRSVCGVDRMADHWCCVGDLWILLTFQVSLGHEHYYMLFSVHTKLRCSCCIILYVCRSEIMIH